ncbi:MAG: VWA domain-containing protein [Proteobacteria bacterium]|nr:VWA domain-containing protein [Pseudomonadota bacterium]
MNLYIQQWNSPHLIYLLIPVMLGMLAFVYQDIWKLFRAHHIKVTLAPDNTPYPVKSFIIKSVCGGLLAFILSTAFLLALPLTFPLPSFILAISLNTILVVILHAWMRHQIKKANLLPEQVHQNIENFTSPNLIGTRFTIPTVTLIIFALLILAMMGPEGNERTTRLKRTPLKITLLFDLSTSMTATDVAPSRLQAAKNETQALLKHTAGDDVGLIFFTDSAFIQSPQTLDIETLKTFIRLAEPKDMPSQGTDINKALELALTTFDPNDDIYFQNHNMTRRVVLITDGETHTGDLNNTLEKYLERKIQIDILAIGTENGAEIFDSQQRPIQYQGKNVISKLNTQKLQDIADATNGIFTKYRIPEHAVQTLIANWDAFRINAKPSGLVSSIYRIQLYHIFLYPAYLLALFIFIHPILNLMLKPKRIRKAQNMAEKSQEAKMALSREDEKV